MKNGRLIDVQTHCFRLGDLLGRLDNFSLMSAIDWLTIASGVESVNVRTAKHDESVLYCRGAYEFEEKRSELLSHLTTKLTIFNFVWGSFESVVKAFGFPLLPKHLKKGTGRVVDRTIWFLKQHYGSEPSLAFYNDCLCNLCECIEHNEYYNGYRKEFKFQNFADLPGLGLHVVRKIRNDLVHGSAVMPLPDGWGGTPTKLLDSEHRHLYLVEACTRILLFTIQMFLLAQVRGEKIIVDCLLDAREDDVESTVQLALHQIHLDIDLLDWDELSLFNETNLSLIET